MKGLSLHDVAVCFLVFGTAFCCDLLLRVAVLPTLVHIKNVTRLLDARFALGTNDHLLSRCFLEGVVFQTLDRSKVFLQDVFVLSLEGTFAQTTFSCSLLASWHWVNQLQINSLF